jgi:hypothetical protein
MHNMRSGSGLRCDMINSRCQVGGIHGHTSLSVSPSELGVNELGIFQVTNCQFKSALEERFKNGLAIVI